MYCFVNWRQDVDGKRLDLPEDWGYMILASPSYKADFALAEVHTSEEYVPDMPVSPELENLLGAAKQYAPALAMTRETMNMPEPAAPQEFERVLVERLRHYLRGQHHHPYFLAEALVTELGYKYAGTYYWIVGYRPDRIGREIEWVSRDFYIYQDGLDEFNVEIADLKRRFPDD